MEKEFEFLGELTICIFALFYMNVFGIFFCNLMIFLFDYYYI